VPSRLPRFSLVTVTLLLSLFSPLYPTPYTLLPAAAQTTQDRKSEAEDNLKLGQSIDKEIRGGETHKYYVILQSGQYLHVVVEQKGIDVVVILFDPNGKQLASSDSPNSDNGPEPVSAIAEASGNYRIEVRTPPSSGKGSYIAKILELRTSTEKDRSYIAAERAFMEAGQLSQKPAREDKQRAIAKYLEALPVFRSERKRYWEALSFLGIGLVYKSLSQYPKALEFYQQALVIIKQVGDRAGEGATLTNIGASYFSLGQYPKALEFYQQALAILKQVGDRSTEGTTLNNIGEVYRNLGKYPKGLEFFQQALKISKEVGNRSGEGTILNNIAGIYLSLGQYPKALEFFQQALKIIKELGNRSGEGTTLNNIGGIYFSLGQYPKALEFYQQALAIIKQVGDRFTEGTTLNNIGEVYRSLGQYPKALEFYQQALAIIKQVGDRSGEGTTLNNIGLVYDSLGQYPKALEFYQQALAIIKQVGDRSGEGKALSNIGYLMDAQKQPELAIAFFKQSVNVREAIRKDLEKLKREEQAAYTQTVADTYRTLANILLQQNRVMESLQVLDLLKVQELEDYLKNTKGNEKTTQGIKLLSPEQQFFSSHKAFTDLEFSKNPAVNTLVQQLGQISQAELNAVPESLKKIPKDSVLLYPVILDNRLELVLFSPGSPPVHRPVAVKKEELEAAIATFKTELSRRPVSAEDNDDVKASAQKLHKWLIEPIKADLDRIKPQTITYAPDGKLRYIPLAALHDGKQWLAQQYRIHNIVSYNLTDFDIKPQPQTNVLAGAFGGKRDEKRFNFSGLPATIPEVQNIAANLPNTVTLIEADFNRKTLESKINNQKNYNIVHLATHAQFVDGTPDASFILFGNGDKVTLREVKEWQLGNVDLVVLSACQTGLGGLGSGVEILGLGYQFQVAGSKSAIATLWEIDDGGTQVLMDKFYPALKQGTPTAEALHQAQLKLINSKPTNGQPDTSQPYYWSAFILIGNGL
jgi:CHAT domain-containing protein